MDVIPKSNESSAKAGGGTFVWDLSTRVFHWSLVGMVAVSCLSGQLGYMDIHVASGLSILALIGFRLAWGLFGGRHARFVSFVKGPKAVIAYAKAVRDGAATHHAGHNPLGGWSVVSILAVVLVQSVTGLFANDDIMTEGPLYKYVSRSTAHLLNKVHHMNSSLLYVLISVHICAVLFYLWQGDNLIRPMITGRKHGLENTGAADDARGSLILAVMFIAVAAWMAYAIGKL